MIFSLSTIKRYFDLIISPTKKGVIFMNNLKHKTNFVILVCLILVCSAFVFADNSSVEEPDETTSANETVEEPVNNETTSDDETVEEPVNDENASDDETVEVPVNDENASDETVEEPVNDETTSEIDVISLADSQDLFERYGGISTVWESMQTTAERYSDVRWYYNILTGQYTYRFGEIKPSGEGWISDGNSEVSSSSNSYYLDPQTGRTYTYQKYPELVPASTTQKVIVRSITLLSSI